MKNILFFIPSLMDGGAEKVLVNLVNNMDKRKYQITILTIVDCGVNKQFLDKSIKYESIFKRYFKGSSILLKILSKKYIYNKYIGNKYDIVISYLEGITSRIVSSAPVNIKKICWIHTEINNYKMLTCGFRSKKEAVESYGGFDKIICVSQSVKIAFEDITKIKVPIDVLYNTNETEKIKESSLEEIDDVNLDDNVYNLCSVGKIIESKGFDRLARIHKRLLEDGIKNHIYILGKGPDEEKINKYLIKEDIKDTFTFLGYKKNPYKYISKCDLYVCASKKEGFSTAVTESLLVGVPVITTKCAGMEELLGANNQYGIVVENDEDSLYNCLNSILKDKSLLSFYKEMAIKRGDKFSREKTVKAVEYMIDNL